MFRQNIWKDRRMVLKPTNRDDKIQLSIKFCKPFGNWRIPRRMSILTFHSEALCLIPEQMQPKEQAGADEGSAVPAAQAKIFLFNKKEKSVNKKSLYQSEMIKLPAPHFVVFYNGKEKKPEDTTIKLSDAFLQKEEEPELELKVRYLNINQGCNQELMKRCRTLREYSEFVTRIRRYADGKAAIEEAVDRAVTECIEEGILSDFLRI